MRIIAIAFLSLLLLGCSSERLETGDMENQSNDTQLQPNGSDAPQTQPSSSYSRFEEGILGFEYPSDMTLEHQRNTAGGLITATHETADGTGEILAIAYTDIAEAYGQNQVLVYSKNPQTVPSELLEKDLETDPMGFLMKADSIGEISTFSISKDLLVAEAPFTLMLNSGSIYHGYAISVYVPDRGIHLNVRVIARDGEDAKEIRDNLLLTLRIR